MFHQITKKIIALVTTVCLLVGVMVVPSAAADDTQLYSYNGVELPLLPVRDESKYPYAYVTYLDSIIDDRDGYYVWFTHRPLYATSVSCLCFHGEEPVNFVRYKVESGVWASPFESALGSSHQFYDLLWANVDVYFMNHDSEDSSLYEETDTLVLAASDPVPVIEDVEDGESILDVLNSILDYDVATWNLLAYGINRVRFIERDVADIREALLKLVPSEQETAIRETFADTSSAVVEEMRGGGFLVTRDDATSFFESGRQVTSTFDTGTTVGDFFSVFTDYVFTGWFSEETRADLDTVNAVSTLDADDDDPYNHDSYEKNMEAFQEFLGRSEAVND